MVQVLKKSHLVAKHQIDRTRVEKEIMDRVRHPFIMTLYAAFQSENFLFMMMDYCRYHPLPTDRLPRAA